MSGIAVSGSIPLCPILSFELATRRMRIVGKRLITRTIGLLDTCYNSSVAGRLVLALDGQRRSRVEILVWGYGATGRHA